ncbi:type II toxin-antitoxin system PemK/MazF family toxin [bacterium]|nr:type II toxin-antitoxin system PemK/MazF family toxin [bacterium]
MTNYKRGDVVLLNVVFSEGKGSKKRPALIISGNEYNTVRQEVIIAAITSNVKRTLPGDTGIKKWKEAGLHFPSQVMAVIQTFKSNLVYKKLGKMKTEDLKQVKINLKKAMEF